jgi:hypothetical protein
MLPPKTPPTDPSTIRTHADEHTAKPLHAGDVVLPSIIIDEKGEVPDDGVKFINIYDFGNSELGRMLSPITHMPFVHPVYGSFQTLQGFWEWIKSEERPDAIRYVSGKQAVHIGRGLTKIYLANFQELIVQANFCRIDQNERLRKEFLLSSLPFEMYYIRNPGTKDAIAIRPSNREIIVQATQQVRDLMWHGNVPEGFEAYVRPPVAR